MTSRTRRPTSTPVTSRRPDPLVWAEALKQAGGDARRLKVLGDGTVLVGRSNER